MLHLFVYYYTVFARWWFSVQIKPTAQSFYELLDYCRNKNYDISVLRILQNENAYLRTAAAGGYDPSAADIYR